MGQQRQIYKKKNELKIYIQTLYIMKKNRIGTPQCNHKNENRRRPRIQEYYFNLLFVSHPYSMIDYCITMAGSNLCYYHSFSIPALLFFFFFSTMRIFFSKSFYFFFSLSFFLLSLFLWTFSFSYELVQPFD